MEPPRYPTVSFPVSRRMRKLRACHSAARYGGNNACRYHILPDHIIAVVGNIQVPEFICCYIPRYRYPGRYTRTAIPRISIRSGAYYGTDVACYRIYPAYPVIVRIGKIDIARCIGAYPYRAKYQRCACRPAIARKARGACSSAYRCYYPCSCIYLP